MKKGIFCLVMAMMTSVSVFANISEKMVECQVVDARESLVIKNNVKRTYTQDSDLTISFKIDGDVLNFNVYEKVCENGKVFLLGRGNYNVNIICVDGGNICIPISKERKLLIENKHIADHILQLVNDMPTYNVKLNGIK